MLLPHDNNIDKMFILFFGASTSLHFFLSKCVFFLFFIIQKFYKQTGTQYLFIRIINKIKLNFLDLSHYNIDHFSLTKALSGFTI